MKYEPENISRNYKRNKILKCVSIIGLYLLLIPILIFSLMLIIADVNGVNNSIYKLNIYNVISDSMFPKIEVGDMVFVKTGYKPEQYKEGNIITFKDSNGDIITHRIEKKINDYEYITKGDNNANADIDKVLYEDIIGKVVYIVNKTNIFFKILKNKAFFIVCILILIFITIYDMRVRKRKIERKTIREKYDKKSDFYF